jgi:hypothetical protein
MICRRLVKVGTGISAYYDITGGHGLRNYATDDEATVQTVGCELRLVLGEWFLDKSLGIPLPQCRGTGVKPILGVHPADLAYAETVLKAAVLRVPGVHSITLFTLDLNHTTRAGVCTVHGLLESGVPFQVSEAVL